MLTGATLLVPYAVAAAAVAAAIDARTGHIPNWLTLGTLGTAPVLAFAVGFAGGGAEAGAAALGVSLLGALVCALGPTVAFFRGGLGGGDVKLLAAMGALLGPRLGLDVEVLGFLFGALYFPAKLAWAGKLGETVLGVIRSLRNPFVAAPLRAALPAALRMQIRLGPAVLAAVLVTVLFTRGAP